MDKFSYAIKAKKTSKKPMLFIIVEAKNETAAERKVMVALDDAEIETGKGGDYFSPSRVEYCAFDDLPETGVLDEKFFDRYALNDDLTISPSAAPVVEENIPPQLPEQSNTPVLKTVAELPWRQRLLVHIWNDEYSYNADQEIVKQAYSRELDTDDKYSQNLILACDHSELKALSDFNLWAAMSAVREVFPLSAPAPLLADVCAFVKKYIETEYIDRKRMVIAWKAGNRNFVVKRTPSGASAGGLNRTDRGEGFNHTKDTLAVEVALGVLGRSMDFDIYNPPASTVNRAREMVDKKEKPFIDWYEAWRSLPGGLDYSRAIVIYSVKCAPDDQPLAPGALLSYLRQILTETDHEHPAPEVVAAACGMTPDEIAQPETPASDEASQANTLALDLNQKIAVAMYDPSVTPEKVTTEILEAAMLELSRKEPAFVRAQKALMYLADTLNDYSDEEIFTAVRAVDFNTLQGTVMYRRTALQALGETVVFDEDGTSEDEEEQAQARATSGVDDAGPEVQAMDATAADAGKPAEEVRPGRTIFSVAELLNAPAAAPVALELPQPEAEAITPDALTFKQQLLLAAVQGLCANPAYATSFDDISSMARAVAESLATDEE